MSKIDSEFDRIMSEEPSEIASEIAKEQITLADRAFREGDYVKATKHYHIAFNNDPKSEYRAKEFYSLYNAWIKAEGLSRYNLDSPQSDYDDYYKSAGILVKDSSFTLQEVAEHLNALLAEWEFLHLSKLGIYLSAIVSEEMKTDDTCTLQVIGANGFLGAFHERGTLLLEHRSIVNTSNVQWLGEIDNVGFGMRGGKIVANGIFENYGNNMENGELVIEKAARGGFTNMKGGTGIIKSFTESDRSLVETIGEGQTGGVIEIYDNISYRIKSIGHKQTGGELRVHKNKNVYCEYIGCYKGDGKIIIEGNVLGFQQRVGQGMTAGDIIIEGNAGDKDPNRPDKHVLLGFQQKGGKISVKGNVYGSVASDAYPGSKIEIKGNVEGGVGGNDAAGVEVYIGGFVIGDIGHHCYDMNCTIKGNVLGDVCYIGQRRAKDRKRNSRIEIFGNVDGKVGDGIYPNTEIIVHGDVQETGEVCGGTIQVYGKIRKIGYCICGKVYQHGIDVTRINPLARVMKKAMLGEDFFE